VTYFLHTELISSRVYALRSLASFASHELIYAATELAKLFSARVLLVVYILVSCTSYAIAMFLSLRLYWFYV